MVMLVLTEIYLFLLDSDRKHPMLGLNQTDGKKKQIFCSNNLVISALCHK